MENRKIIVGVAALAALLLLFAGVGYATFTGNAKTYNDGNEDTLAYMTATPSDFSPFAAKASTLFDTYVYGNYVQDDTPTQAELDAGLYYTESGGVYTKASGTLGDGPYYVVGEAKNTAYAFVPAMSPATVNGKTAVQLGTDKIITLKNETGAAISEIKLSISTPVNIGSTDFVYFFGVTVAGGSTQYLPAFANSKVAELDNIACAIADGFSKDVTVALYLGYVADVYVPESYIGPASETQTGSFTHPYILPDNPPADLGSTGFSFTFTDSTPAA